MLEQVRLQQRHLTVRYSQCMTTVISHTLRISQFILEIVSALNVRLSSRKSAMAGKN
jgi:hypothetical protein